MAFQRPGERGRIRPQVDGERRPNPPLDEAEVEGWPVGNSLADALVRPRRVEGRQAADFAPLPPDAGLVSDFASDLPSDAVESLPTSFLAPFPPPARA